MPRTRSAGPRARKALGQHFLRDSGVLADIVAAVRVPPGGVVLEIGAGTGQLTEALLEAGHDVVALEIEERLVAHLRQRFRGDERLRIVQADARVLDVAPVLPGRSYVAVGNLPYFAANPIIRHFLESPQPPNEMVVMVQREVARELAAKPGSSSLLSISVEVYARAAELLFDVPPEAFDPPPAVYSSVVRLELRAAPLVPRARIPAFFTLVSKTFRNPRKQIHNALARETGLTAIEAETALTEAQIDGMRRAETLSVGEWIALLDAVEAVKAHG